MVDAFHEGYIADALIGQNQRLQISRYKCVVQNSTTGVQNICTAITVHSSQSEQISSNESHQQIRKQKDRLFQISTMFPTMMMNPWNNLSQNEHAKLIENYQNVSLQVKYLQEIIIKKS